MNVAFANALEPGIPILVGPPCTGPTVITPSIPVSGSEAESVVATRRQQDRMNVVEIIWKINTEKVKIEMRGIGRDQRSRTTAAKKTKSPSAKIRDVVCVGRIGCHYRKDYAAFRCRVAAELLRA